MNNLIIYFDGILQNIDDFDGTESASFVFRKKTEGGESAFSFAPELTVTGEAYLYVKQQIISAPNPTVAAIQVEIYDTCCLDDIGNARLLFTGKIEGADVRWCTVPACEAQVTIIDNSQDAEAIRCLKEVFPWQGTGNIGDPLYGFDEFRQAPWIYYCNDLKPSATQEAIMILGLFLFIILAPLLLLFQIGNVIAGLNRNEFEILSNLIVGCGRRHLAPFLDSQFRNLCKHCNLNYTSSLFGVGGPYHNTVRLDIPYVEGKGYSNQGFPEFGIGSPVELNKPNLNGVQFLDQLQQFNIDWRIVNGSLIIERKDYFAGTEWFNLDNLEDEQILSICWDSTGEKPASYAEYLYARDGIDNSGDEVIRMWCDRVIDWNPSNNPQQVGMFQRNLTFSAAQFRFDGNAPDVNPIDKPGYVAFYPFVNNTENTIALFLSKGISSFPKLINLRAVEPISGEFRGFGVPELITLPNGKRGYNYSWWIKKNQVIDINGNAYDTAYQRLFEIDDPRATTVKTRKITITITADCQLLTALSVDKYISTPDGQVEVQEITYDTNNNSLTINGLI